MHENKKKLKDEMCAPKNLKEVEWSFEMLEIITLVLTRNHMPSRVNQYLM